MKKSSRYAISIAMPGDGSPHFCRNKTATLAGQNAAVIMQTIQEFDMRSFLIVSAAALGLGACAGQPAAPAAPANPAAPSAAAPKAPQCWNGDTSKFMEVGSQASISGVPVSCEKTSDGKSAQWMGKK